MAAANTLKLDESNFDAEVLHSNQPVLVDFWAEWCGPCQLLAPTIDELAGEYAGKVKIGKCDIDKSPNLTSTYGVQSIPTILIFENGKPVERVVGAKPKRELKALLDARVGVKA